MQEENRKINNLLLAHQAVNNYVIAMQQLSKKQRRLFLKGIDRKKQKEIKKLHKELAEL
ncbi:hypothetical protein KKF29_04265 [Patescibacteria group bacterium]|nr:hypothetical protein [Patescibacteria group bacterium]